MPYLLKSLIGTDRDPTRRAGQKHARIRKGRLCIGARSLGPACSMTVSDTTYAAYKSVIDEFVGLKALEVKQLLGSLDGNDLAAALGHAAAAPEPEVAAEEAAAPAEEAAPEEAADEAAAPEEAAAKSASPKAKKTK